MLNYQRVSSFEGKLLLVFGGFSEIFGVSDQLWKHGKPNSNLSPDGDEQMEQS